MENGQDFVDYYDVLQVNPNCDARILEIAYHYFAKMYHPDHAETADPDRFSQVVEAYGVLRDSERRAEYDRSYPGHRSRSDFLFPASGPTEIDEKTALSDGEIHERMLLCLYKRRREHPADPGVIGWLLQEMLDCSEDHFEFHVWYLKSKGLLDTTEEGKLAVTIQGVDHVIATSRTHSAEKLLLARTGDEAD